MQLLQLPQYVPFEINVGEILTDMVMLQGFAVTTSVLFYQAVNAGLGRHELSLSPADVTSYYKVRCSVKVLRQCGCASDLFAKAHLRGSTPRDCCNGSGQGLCCDALQANSSIGGSNVLHFPFSHSCLGHFCLCRPGSPMPIPGTVGVHAGTLSYSWLFALCGHHIEHDNRRNSCRCYSSHDLEAKDDQGVADKRYGFIWSKDCVGLPL